VSKLADLVVYFIQHMRDCNEADALK